MGSKVLFAGGVHATGYSDVVDIFDTVSRTWSVAHLSQPRTGLAAASVGGKAIFAGGIAATGDSAVVDLWDLASDTWTTASLSEARHGLVAVSNGTVALLAGGLFSYASGVGTVDAYDSSTGIWSVATMPGPGRYGHSGSLVGSSAYFASGVEYGFSPYHTSYVTYDFASGAWTFEDNALFGRYGFGATVVGDLLLLAGGTSPTSPISLVEILDTQSGLLTTTSLSQQRRGLAAVTLGHYAIFAGGETQGGGNNAPTAIVDLYDAVLGTWSVSSLSAPRNELVAVTAGSEAFFAGGWDGGAPSDVVDVYLLIDCNDNGIDDALDVSGGTSPDCDANGIPDECESDFNTSSIVHVEIPADSADVCGSQPCVDGVWSVSAPPFPLATDTGVGQLVRPGLDTQSDLGVLHDHIYAAPHVPDPARAVVTYEFAVPVVVDQIEVAQTINGITQIEGFVGDSTGNLVSIGQVFGPDGDVTGPVQFGQGAPYVFSLNNQTPGLVFRFVITKTSLSDGYAIFRAYPRSPDGIRIPAAGEDADGDGFDTNVDCDDGDPLVNPAAVEICDNGIDDDCDGLVDNWVACAGGVAHSNYCTAAPNSASATGAAIDASGSSNVIANDLVLMAGPVPPNEFGVFFHAAVQVQFPFGDGFQCAAGGLVRVSPVTQADGAGTMTKSVNLSGPDGTWIAPGVTRNFQLWYRDPAGGPNGYNLSDGIAVCFY